MSRLTLRILTALWALWFGVALVEPAALQTCPMHGAHGGHAMRMAVDPGHEGSAQHGGPTKDSKNACTCLGACCCAPTVAAPLGQVAELPTSVVRIDASRPTFASEVATASAPRYAHPFANGPPPLVPVA